MTLLIAGKIFLAAALAAAVGLSTHVGLQKWAVPRFAALTGASAKAPEYSRKINIAAYLTALASMTVLCVIYYLVADTFLTGWLAIDAIVFCLLLLEIKGNVLRMPFMTWLALREGGHPRPFYGMMLQMVDQWVAGFALGIIIVVLCPVKPW